MKAHQPFRRHMLTDEQKETLVKCLNCEISLEQAGNMIGCSKQQTINLITSIIRQLAQDKKINAKKLLANY
jgi:hypothetical protein